MFILLSSSNNVIVIRDVFDVYLCDGPFVIFGVFVSRRSLVNTHYLFTAPRLYLIVFNVLFVVSNLVHSTANDLGHTHFTHTIP